MAKLPRKTQKIFCSKPTSENQTSVFGTMKTADKQYSTDVGTLQSNAAYEQGWKSATIASYKPFMEDFNTLNYINTSQLAYLFQQGIPEWDESTAYYKNSFCSYNGDLWKSLIDDNLNNTPLEGESWTLFTSGKKSGSGLELCDIGTALYVDETKGLRRRLNGSIMDITSNYQAFLTRLKEITTLYPSLVCTESEWQTTKTMSKLGQCGKFVYNYGDDGTTVTSIRLPLVININGLVDMSNAGLIKDESLPNISGKFGTGNNNGTWYGGIDLRVDGCFRNDIPCPNPNQYLMGNTNGSNAKAFAFDASRSSSTYQDDAPVQQEAIQYPYFIQVATGSETENNITNTLELNNPYVLFKSEYFEAPPYNLSWLKSDGEYKPKATYIKAYEALVVENNSSIAVGTTVDLPSGTKYTKRGLSVKLSTATDITDYDFVLNTAEETFRLPLKTKLASGKAVVGNGKALMLTNGTQTGALSACGSGASGNVGGFLRPVNGADGINIGDTAETTNKTQFVTDKAIGIVSDPTKSGIELSDSGLYLYFYVGETVQNANLIDAGRIGEQLSNCLTRNNKEEIVSWGMPDYDAGITKTTNTLYTAEVSGFVWVYNFSNGGSTIEINGTKYVYQSGNGNGQYVGTSVFLPISKDDTYKVDAASKFIFYPCKGV